MGGPLKSIPASQPRRAGTSTGWAWTRLSSLTTANKDTRQPGPTTGSSPPLQSAGSPERGWTSCASAVYSSPPLDSPFGCDLLVRLTGAGGTAARGHFVANVEFMHF